MRTIRGKLVLAFLLVILVCLIPTSVAAAYVIRYYQRQDALENLASYGETVAGAAITARFSNLTPSDIVNVFADQRNQNVRVLLTDVHGVVQADSQNKDVGTTWPISAPRADFRQVPIRPEYKGQMRAPDGASLAVAIYRVDRRAGRTGAGQAGQNAQPPADQASTTTYVIVAVPWSSISNVWAVIGSRLKWILIVALLLAVALAFFLSRSLTSRLHTLTLGANAMARGDYEGAMRLASVGAERDEVGDLAAAFRVMASSVARAQRAQRDLVANASHELKTPLTSIQGFSQAMLDGTVSDDRDYQEMAQIIQQEAQRMRRLVEQMLELSRLESGTVGLEQAAFPVDELIENVGRRYQRLGEAKDVAVHVSAPVGLNLVADAGRLEQVLVNLLDNALQYTDAGGRVALRALAARPNSVQFVIEDTGHGIPADDIPRLFERFYQVERSRAGQGQHVGLGLAIVREIVDAHQGTITVQSAPGEGTTITVTIPGLVGAIPREDALRPVTEFAMPTRSRAAGSG